MIFIDCESAGLRGQIFAAAMINPDGSTLFNGFYRHIDLQSNSWLRENVEPNLSGVEYPDRETFLAATNEAWSEARSNKIFSAVAHMGSPVESNFFQQLYEVGQMGEFNGPYPLHDTAPLIYQAGYDPTSEQDFATAAGIELPEEYKPHCALSDAQLTRLVWYYFSGVIGKL